MFRRLAVLPLAVLVVACAPTTSSPSVPPASTPTTTSTTAPAAPGCSGSDLPFGSDGLVSDSGAEAGDAATIEGIAWAVVPGCERFTVTFRAASGAPATAVGPFAVSVLPTVGIVRVTLDASVQASGIADVLADTDLVDRVYVVRSTDRTLHLDLHLATTEQVAARGFAAPSGDGIIVDLRRGEDRRVVLSPPRRGGDVVVLSPAPGPSLYPLRAAGYVAPGTAAVRIRMSDPDGALVADRSVAVPVGDDAWAAFDVAIGDGPGGMVEMFIGTIDALGLDAEGVTVPLDLP